MADIDGSADPTDPTPAPPDAPPATEAAGPGPGGPKLSRRVALGMIGGGVVAGAGFLTTRRVLEAEETASKRVQPAAPSSTQGSAPATTTTQPAAAPSTQHALWSDPATWGGQVPGAGDLATVTQPVKTLTGSTTR